MSRTRDSHSEDGEVGAARRSASVGHDGAEAVVELGSALLSPTPTPRSAATVTLLPRQSSELATTLSPLSPVSASPAAEQQELKAPPDAAAMTISEPAQQEGLDEAELQQLIAPLRGRIYELGLSSAEAAERLQRYGRNEIVEKKRSAVLTFLRYFWGPIAFIIEAAAVLSAVLSSWADCGIILVLLLLNAVIGFWEEHNAGNAVAALKKNIPRTATVCRDGVWSTGAVEDVTVGDLISVKLGDMICADTAIVRIHPSHPVLCDQSALTGESRPVKRRLGGRLLSGSIVKEGEAACLVTHTGAGTFVGRAALLVNASQDSGHFQKLLTKIGNFLILSAAVSIIIIVAYGVVEGLGVSKIIQFCLVLAIASIPVALPTVLSVSMAVGSRELSRRNAICTRLTAIEELSGIDVLCCDKTGTLTKNELTADAPICFADDGTGAEVMPVAALAASLHHQDSIDRCLVEALGKDRELFLSFRQLDLKPFNPVWKRAEALVQCPDGSQWICTKGAPQSVFKLLPAAEQARLHARVQDCIQDLASRGLRAIAVARIVVPDSQLVPADAPLPSRPSSPSVVDHGDAAWQLLGLIPLYDPPRDDSVRTIQRLLELGVAVKMITGDQVEIARDTASRLGMRSNILNCDRLTVDQAVAAQIAATRRLPAEVEELAALVESSDGFGQVFPDHKHLVVSLLQARGHTVGMTGDGVNDAPALKQANVGVAVSGATDAARGAADVVLLSCGLGVIVDAIIESRRIFSRMNAYVLYRCCSTMNELVFLTLAILVYQFVLPPLMLVLIALFNDVSVIVIAFDHATYAQRPVDWDMKEVVTKTLLLGSVLVAASFLLLYLTLELWALDSDVVATMIFIQLSLGTQLNIFSTRIASQSFLQLWPSRYVLMSVCGTQLVASLLAVYGGGMTGIGWGKVALVWAFCALQFLVFDACKQAIARVLEAVRAAPSLQTRFAGATVQQQAGSVVQQQSLP